MTGTYLRFIMLNMERKYEISRIKVDIPFEGDEAKRFEAEAAERCVVKGQLMRRLLLTWMDPATGPIVEAAMRGRPAPDLDSVQARELSESIRGKA